MQWKFSSEALLMGARHVGPEALAKAVAKSRVSFMGDSITRHLAASFLRSVGSKEVVQYKHSTFELPLPEKGSSLKFYWRPFPRNVTEGLQELLDEAEQPQFLVLSFCLWHVLMEHDLNKFAADVKELEKAAKGLVAARGTQVLMLECPDVAESKHSNPDKKKYLTKGIVGKHLRAMRELRSGPWHWLPLHDITRACNDGCSTDGVHSGFVVYDTVVQWLANQLRLGI